MVFGNGQGLYYPNNNPNWEIGKNCALPGVGGLRGAQRTGHAGKKVVKTYVDQKNQRQCAYSKHTVSHKRKTIE
jgi:hypothetical protein